MFLHEIKLIKIVEHLETVELVEKEVSEEWILTSNNYVLCSSFLFPPSGQLMHVLVNWRCAVVQVQYSNSHLKSHVKL